MQFLDKAGVQTIVTWIRNHFVNKSTVKVPVDIPAASFGEGITVGEVDGKIFRFTMPANPNTDTKVTSVANHYVPEGGTAATATAGSAVAWGGAVVTGVTKDAAGHVTGVTTGTIPSNPNTNSASLQVGSTTDKKINTSETTGKYIQFAGGANKFTVSDGTNSFEVPVTPSITNNITGTGTSGQAAVFNGANTLTSRAISTSVATDNSTNLVTEGAVKSYVDNATSGLSGAMHYIGTSTSAITDGGTQNPTISGYSGTAKTAGNVVLYNSKEFVWTGTAWEEYGDEGSYALKSVSVTGTGALSGGGTLTEDRTIVHNTSGVSAGTYGPNSNVTGNEGTTMSVPEITVDAYGHVTAVNNRTYTAKNTTYTALKNPNALNIGTKPSTSGTATNRVTYDGSASGQGLYFSSAAASNTNVQFAVDANGFVTGTVTESVNTDRYVNSAAFASQGTNGANGTQMTLTRAGSDTATVTATIPVATTSAAGVMSGAMVSKLNGIDAGATANTGTVTSITPGVGLVNGSGTKTAITTSGTVKAALNSETSLGTIGTTSKLYAVGVDANGKLCVNVPWTEGTVDTEIPDAELEAILNPA